MAVLPTELMREKIGSEAPASRVASPQQNYVFPIRVFPHRGRVPKSNPPANFLARVGRKIIQSQLIFYELYKITVVGALSKILHRLSRTRSGD
jgi:hypothetical protein